MHIYIYIYVYVVAAGHEVVGLKAMKRSFLQELETDFLTETSRAWFVQCNR